MTVTALLCPGASLAGRIIAAVERDAISHIACDLGTCLPLVASEQWSGLTLWPAAQYTDPAIVRWPLPLTPEQEEAVRGWLLARVGQGYDYGQLGYDLVDIETHLRLVDPLAAGRYVCSGALAGAVKAASWWPFAPDLPAAAIRPDDWHRAWRVASRLC